MLAAAAVPAMAQTRAAVIQTARDEKALRLRPEAVSSLENALLQLKERKVLERLTSGLGGFGLQFGNMATGSGFAAGPQFLRDDLAGGRLRIHASASISTRSWHKYQAAVTAPRLAGGRLSLGVEAARRDYRALDYYGNGPDSRRTARSVYRQQDTLVECVAVGEPVRRLRVGGSVGGLWVDLGTSNRDEFAKTETLFQDSSTPGLAAQTHFLRSSVFGQYDYRDDPAGPKSGGNYGAEFSRHDDRSIGTYSFRRWDVDLQHYVPLFNKTRRIALRARMSMTDPDSGSRMPFYLQPRLGGSDDLRGFRPYRFTDRNAIVYNAEYRWEIFAGLDGALFFDAGKVMPRRGQLSMADLEVSPGFGLRFNAANRTFLRLDVGFSHEGVGFWLKFNDVFLPRLFGAATRQPMP
jgi:outer membrane protein assembly factor BamA